MDQPDRTPPASRAFFDTLERHGDRVALIEGDREITYTALASEARRFAERLGTQRSLVFLEASNGSAAIAAYLGCLIGRHPVYLFADADWPKARDLIDRYRPNLVLRCRDGAYEEHSRSRDVHHLHPDLRVLLSTSGSTGSPKFVKLSGTNLQSNAASIAEYLCLSPTERAVTSLPFNYSYGMSIVNSYLASGASLVLTDRSVAEAEFWDLFRRNRGTSFAGVPYTFELLRHVSFAWADTPGLSYVTQAGGRLSPDLVRYFAGLGERHGWRFFVMYGQTEASPRMAYLPPERAATYPHCIGVPIPGGTFELLDEDGRSIVDAADRPGELVYSGPNVMMGYAKDASDLATSESPERLFTGDIACRNETGLYYVVGRKSRFVKPFGIRLNLDEMQQQLRQWAAGAVCTGSDERIVIGIPREDGVDDTDAVVRRLAALYNLPPFLFSVIVVDRIPLLSSGKIDYVRLSELAPGGPHASGSGLAPDRFPLLSAGFVRQFVNEIGQILGFTQEKWTSVADIFSALTGAEEVDGRSTFAALGGDSLHFVQVQLALESYLGGLPDDWEHLSADELERSKADALSL